ncbi:DDE-type integrase/transposase/recombinase [Streptomyces sp. NPDC057611]|uniref:DDE-type integrase/transposase/recombinase n=1 Tax=Streptomyces sp. NPDC057611 TaxID=3346182 RepID=UPI0036B992A8
MCRSWTNPCLRAPGNNTSSAATAYRPLDLIALWWGDRTEIDTGEGQFYLASVHDAFSGRALGYAMGERYDAALVSVALQMAIATSGGQVDGVIFHTDRGSGIHLRGVPAVVRQVDVAQSMRVPH